MQPIQVLEAADAGALAGFDAIIDVRSPGEFAEDHVPGARNLPVLDDAQRAEIGTIYTQESRFRANRLGAAYVAENIARHLRTPMADWDATVRPLIYCWRGGSRSNAMATILQRVGWPTAVLAGGYRTYRRHVQDRLYEQACPLRFVLLDGDTGSAKTEVLARLAESGLQVLDLEDLAGHRGSLFGGLAGRPQPSQKLFESRLLVALQTLDPSRPVVVEAESSKIGDRMVPPSVWRAMQAAPRIEIVAPRAARARYLVEAYADIITDPGRLEAAFAGLPVQASPARLETWRRLIQTGEFVALAETLMELHYDPAYARARRKAGRAALARIEIPDLDQAAQSRVADQIVQLVMSDLS
jgi:tRNA 2-selenouridine synthase